MSTTEILIARLKATYPTIDFELVGSADFADTFPHTKMPALLIAMTAEDMCIVDPTTTSCGRFIVDPQEVYGISHEDAKAILAHNGFTVPTTAAGAPELPATESKPGRIPLQTPELIAAIANQFIENLSATIGEENLAGVRMRNRHKGTCPSHDFCDADMCMYSALTTIIGLNVNDFNKNSVAALWATAWTLARDCNFVTPYQTELVSDFGAPGARVRHTITHFAEGEIYDAKDLFAIHALGIGETYLKPHGMGGVLHVTRMQ